MVSLTEQIAAQRLKLQGANNGQPVQSGGPGVATPPAVGLNPIANVFAAQQKRAASDQTIDVAPTQIVATPAPVHVPVVVAPKPPQVAVPVRVPTLAVPVRAPVVVAPTQPAPAKSDGRLQLGRPAGAGSGVSAQALSLDEQIAKLSDMDVSGIEARQGYFPPASRKPTYQLPDAHGPAPERNLPADLDDGKKAFVEQLNQVRFIFHDAELFSQVVRIIMQELSLNPEFMDMVMDEDIHFMLRGMREAMGVARVQAGSRKRAAPGQAGEKKPSRAKTSDKMNQLIDTASALGFSFSDD